MKNTTVCMKMEFHQSPWEIKSGSVGVSQWKRNVYLILMAHPRRNLCREEESEE